MTLRYLSDYMTASERAKRTIVRDCKYRPIARIIQHDRAKNALSKFLLKGGTDCGHLTHEASRLRSMMSDDAFGREVLDNNADYIDAFVAAFPYLTLPEAEIYQAESHRPFNLSGVEVNPDVRFALQRVTRTNKLKTGLATLRYSKGKPLKAEVGLFQSSFLYGYRLQMDEGTEAEPEQKLCLTIDAWAGEAHAAPGDALSRFRNMEAACQTIAERWNNVEPPPGAII